MTLIPCSHSFGRRLRPLVALLVGGAICGAASAEAVSYQFTDDKNSTNFYGSAATLSLSDCTLAGLGNGVCFSLAATLTDPIFASGSRITDLGFNGPTGVFNNFAAGAHAAFRGDVLVDSMSYTGGDGAATSGIKFNWTDSGTAFDPAATDAFDTGKTSKWFVGDTTVAQFKAAEFNNPFAILHVNALASGTSMWLLDGLPPSEIGLVPEPQGWLLVATALGLMGWTGRRRHAASRAA